MRKQNKPGREPDDDRPLVAIAEARQAADDEGRRARDYRLSTVRSACRSRNLGGAAERLLCFVAKVAQCDVLRRTAKEICADRECNFSPRTFRRVLGVLEDFGFLDCELAPKPAWKVRGKIPDVYLLRVNWGSVQQAYREHLGVVQAATEKPPGDHAAPMRRPCGDHAATSRQHGGNMAATWRQNASHTISPPIEPLPPSPRSKTVVAEEERKQPSPTDRRSSWRDCEIAAQLAGVGQWSRLIDDAKSNGYTPAELLDDLYVLQHCDKIQPGALMSRVRDRGRCWPTSGIPDAERLREDRQRRAAGIRDRTIRDARDVTPPPSLDAVCAAVARRLSAAGLAEFATDDERQRLAKIERRRANRLASPGRPCDA